MKIKHEQGIDFQVCQFKGTRSSWSVSSVREGDQYCQ